MSRGLERAQFAAALNEDLFNREQRARAAERAVALSPHNSPDPAATRREALRDGLRVAQEAAAAGNAIRAEQRRQNLDTTPPARPWAHLLETVAADAADAPQAAPQDPQAAPQAAPPQETRRRQEDVFTQITQRMEAPTVAEAAALPVDVQVRRAFHSLSGPERKAIEDRIQREDFGIPGYFDSRGYGQDYRAVLVSATIARRLQDAQRLRPELTPADFLAQLTI